ncbi:hypothetical protein LOD99_10970 [Oopsacas minuta]|uniref:EGF-like domain-containing protein n=1 Tax=Oopsacas minuta TaxID=111878 RepID=A0AAV7KC91_9METZ|nr:hypothetical protein LOD99_10970 [Oopsacas minuta]
MYLLIVCVFLTTMSVTHQQIYCINKCSCDSINPIDDLFIEMDATDCCDSNITSAMGNVNVSGLTITGCVLCPSLCGGGTCEIDPITTDYAANITRPTAGSLLFTISATYTCPGEIASSLSLVYSRGSLTGDILFTIVGESTGAIRITLANPPNEIRTYTGSVNVQLFKNSIELLAETTVNFTFNVYDAIEANATEYSATTTNSRVGGIYLFTAGTITPNFTVVYSIKPLIGDPGSISIDSTTGRAITSTIQPPIVIRTYIGVVLLSYTSDRDPSLTGVIEVQFSFTIALPLTPDPSIYSVILTFPPTTPLNVMAFTITYSFFPGFTINSFTYNFTDDANILNIDDATGSFSFPIMRNTEVKSYPENGNREIVISYFSKEISNNESVYMGTFTTDYVITIVDPCGFSSGATPICKNNGICLGLGSNYSCNCTDTGYTGYNCQININECDANHDLCGLGECHDTNGSFICNCDGTEFIGTRCTVVINEVSLTTVMMSTTETTTNIAMTEAPIAGSITVVAGAVVMILVILFLIILVILTVAVVHQRRKGSLRVRVSISQPLQSPKCREQSFFTNESISSSPTKQPSDSIIELNSIHSQEPVEPSNSILINAELSEIEI